MGFKHNFSEQTIETTGRTYTDTSSLSLVNFNRLRQADYGQGFRQATFGEAVDLAHQSYLNQGNPEADKIVKAIRNFWLSGNTSTLYTPQLVIVQDMPQVLNGRIVMDEKDLTSKLSSKQVNGVIFSQDASIRAIPYGFAKKQQTCKEMRNNPFAIALTGNPQAPEMLAQIQDKIRKIGYVYALDEVSKPVIQVPGLIEYGIGLGLSGGWSEFDDNRFLFGIRRSLT